VSTQADEIQGSTEVSDNVMFSPNRSLLLAPVNLEIFTLRRRMWPCTRIGFLWGLVMGYMPAELNYM
jgi:hypothetical protein